MRTGFAILAHDRLERAAALARHLASRGAPVAVHVDRRAAVSGDFGGAKMFSAHAAEWGMIGLVDAALDAASRLLAGHPDLGHVFLASGACLPLRPVEELDAFLAVHPDTDFIETVPVAEANWVQGGLSIERFTLRFPLPWKRRRRLFDALVAAQRALGVRRQMPVGVVPHLGSQWWCLSARTLRALLRDPCLPAWRAFFRRSWIPDESFFQSLVRTVGEPERLVPRSLTLARFDASGRPHVFHDDHGEWLEGADHFFARKADPDAGGLYERFLDRPRAARPDPAFEGRVDEAPFERARLREPRGLQTQSRYPSGSGPRLLATARDWAVIAGSDAALLDAVAEALRGALPEADIHGRLFAPENAAFAGGGAHGPGNLPADPDLRDYRPEQFLARLIFARRHRRTVFLLGPGDTPRTGQMAVRDANARLIVLDDGDGEAILAALRRRGEGKSPEPVHATVTRIEAGALRDDMTGDALARLIDAIEAPAGENR